jgi:phage terminase small subunit
MVNRTRTTDSSKRANGTDYQKGRMRQDKTPKPEGTLGGPPKWLPLGAKRIWEREAKELRAMGVGARVDRLAFANLCNAQWKVEEQPEAVTVALLNSVRLLASEFGMTPGARSRVEVNKPKEPEAQNPFAAAAEGAGGGKVRPIR